MKALWSTSTHSDVTHPDSSNPGSSDEDQSTSDPKTFQLVAQRSADDSETLGAEVISKRRKHRNERFASIKRRAQDSSKTLIVSETVGNNCLKLFYRYLAGRRQRTSEVLRYRDGTPGRRERVQPRRRSSCYALSAAHSSIIVPILLSIAPCATCSDVPQS